MATDDGSQADVFGRQHLLPLETVSSGHVSQEMPLLNYDGSEAKQANPFFFYDETRQTWKVCATEGVWVDIYYTCDRHICLFPGSLATNGARIYDMKTGNTLQPPMNYCVLL